MTEPDSGGLSSSRVERMCIGITLQELSGRTTEAKAQTAVNNASLREAEQLDSEGEEGTDHESQETLGRASSAHGEPQQETLPDEAIPQASEPVQQPEKGSTKKTASASADKAFFFDRTTREHRGAPLLREFSVKGFAVYIDSGTRTRLISFPPLAPE